MLEVFKILAVLWNSSLVYEVAFLCCQNYLHFLYKFLPHSFTGIGKISQAEIQNNYLYWLKEDGQISNCLPIQLDINTLTFFTL